jgi:hypothetical protein
MAIAMMRGQFADLRQPFAVVRAKITQNRQQIEERQPTCKHDEENIAAMRGDDSDVFWRLGAKCNSDGENSSIWFQRTCIFLPG